jgi:hypothetical protein
MTDNAFAAAAAETTGTTPTEATTTATETTPPPLAERIPEKYRVLNAEGVLDLEASAAKLNDGYAELSKRFGAGDAPPKTAEEYAPELPEGFDMEALKADPLYQDFLKGAHSRGVTNKQLTYILEEFTKRQDMMADAANGGMDIDTFKAEMAKVWGDDPKAFDTGIQTGLKAIRSYLPGVTQEQLASIPNSPIIAQLLAAIGKDVGEDKRIAAAPIDGKDFDQQIKEIQASPGYADAKHPEHKALMAKQKALFERRYGTK